MRVLVSRTDRIGDVVLSTPVFRALRLHLPNARVTVLTRDTMRPVLAGLDSVDELLSFDPAAHRGVAGTRRLAAEFRKRRFDAAVILYSEPAVAAAAFLARIPGRIGPLSKPHSFLFYNRGIRQRRSQVEKHEADYNLDLLAPLGVRVSPRTLFPEIALSDATRQRAQTWLQQRGWETRAGWIAVHPGMGGSALNWPEERYLEMANALRSEGHRVLLTTGPLERGLATRLRDRSGHGESLLYEPTPGDGIDFLAALYERMSLVVAPSTGPLHLAVAAGTPVLSFYPNLRVQSVARWGPYAADPARAVALTPAADCAADPACMNTITLDTALREARRLLRSHTSSSSH